MEPRPRLLFIWPQFLFPADAGGKIRSTGILRGMKGGLFDITLASAAQGDEAQRFAAPLSEICDRYVAWPAPRAGRLRRVAAMLSSEPLSAALDRSRAGREVVVRLLAEDFDVVVADFVHAAVLLDRLPRASVMFTHNVETEIFARHALHARHGLARAIWRSQCRKMIAFEWRHLPVFGKVIAVSERDLAFFVESYGVHGAEAIPTDIDLDYFGAGEPVRSDVPTLGGEIVFTGSMDWPANIDAMQHFRAAIWPLVAAARPAARLTVVGRNPPARLIEASRGLNWRFTAWWTTSGPSFAPPMPMSCRCGSAAAPASRSTRRWPCAGRWFLPPSASKACRSSRTAITAWPRRPRRLPRKFLVFLPIRDMAAPWPRRPMTSS